MSKYKTDYKKEPLIYGSVSNFNDGLAAIQQKGKWGFIDKNGDIAIPCKYNRAYDFSEGLTLVTEGKNNSYYIDSNGKHTLTPPSSIYADDFHEGLAVIDQYNSKEDTELNGFIDKKGKLVISCIYEDASHFNEGLATVYNGSAWGYINQQGETVIEFKYEDSRDFEDGIAHVGNGNNNIIIDNQGKEIFTWNDDQYQIAWLSHGILVVKENDKWWIRSKNGVRVELANIKDIRNNNCQEGIIVAMDDNNKYGCLNDKGEIVVPFTYDEIDYYNEGYASFKENNKWGFIDKKGKIIIPPIYDNVDDFYDGLVLVYLGKKAFFINDRNEKVISLKKESSSFLDIIFDAIFGLLKK